MKKISYLLMAALGVYAMQGCGGSNKPATTDSTTMVKDSTTVKMAATPKDSSVIFNDSTFAMKAAVGGMAEVALGKMAASKTNNDKIKEFAKMMVSDHSKANTELMDIAKMKKMMLPNAVDAEHQMKMDSLSKLSGVDFDKAYVMAMVDGHKKTLMLMQNEAANGKDAELKAFAAKTAPTVQMHLDAINKINDSMK